MTTYWLFNTDETEDAGRGKYERMLEQEVIAAWGDCRGSRAKATLNRPKSGDIIFYFRAKHGIIAKATVTEELAFSSQSVFRQAGEYHRAIGELVILPSEAPVKVAEIKAASGYLIPIRQIVGRILNKRAITFLLRRFKDRSGFSSHASKQRKVSNGGGFEQDAEKRRRVEKAAIKFVTNAYTNDGWLVDSVEQQKLGYDLICVKGRKVERVEVKGTDGDVPAFIITSKELTQARTDARWVLQVVTRALESPKRSAYTGKDFLIKFELCAIQYTARLRSD